MNKTILSAILLLGSMASEANVLCRLSKIERNDPSKSIAKCYLGEHAVQGPRRQSVGLAYIVDCRLQTPEQTTIILRASNNDISDIYITVAGDGRGNLPHSSNGQFAMDISKIKVDDNYLVECGNLLGQPKVLKFK